MEREFFVEVVGETKICVAVSPNGRCEDEWDSDLMMMMNFEDLDPDFLDEFEDE